jgi:hypothetical protein
MSGAGVLWGVVAYAGSLEDPTKFDGWYVNRRDAESVQKYWGEELPGWNVFLVKRQRTPHERIRPVGQLRHRLGRARISGPKLATDETISQQESSSPAIAFRSRHLGLAS